MRILAALMKALPAIGGRATAALAQSRRSGEWSGICRQRSALLLPRADARLRRLRVIGLLSVLLLGSCALLWEPSAFETGKVLDRGKAEVEVHTGYPWAAWDSSRLYSSNLSLACGVGSGYEARVGFGGTGLTSRGVSPDDTSSALWAVQLGLAKKLSAESPYVASGSLGLDLISPWHEFTPVGVRASACLTPGCYPAGWLGLHLPLRVSACAVEPVGAYVFFVPGVGISLDAKHAFLRAGANWPLLGWSYLSTKGYAWPVFYAGLQVGGRFRVFGEDETQDDDPWRGW